MPSTSKDFRSQFTKLKQQNPDALFVDTQTPAGTDVALGQLKASGWKVSLLLNDVMMGTPDLLLKYKDILDGTIGAEFGVDPTNPKYKNLVDTYMAKYGANVPYQSYGQTEYDSVYIVRDAILAVGYDGDKIAAWGHQIKDWQGASGSITIGTDGDRAGGHSPEIVKNGKVEVYKK